MRENTLFSGKNYTVGKNFTLSPVVTIGTNLTSVFPNAFVETNLVVLGGQGWLPRDTADTSAVSTVGDDHILFCENRTL